MYVLLRVCIKLFLCCYVAPITHTPRVYSTRVYLLSCLPATTCIIRLCLFAERSWTGPCLWLDCKKLSCDVTAVHHQTVPGTPNTAGSKWNRSRRFASCGHRSWRFALCGRPGTQMFSLATGMHLGDSGDITPSRRKVHILAININISIISIVNIVRIRNTGMITAHALTRPTYEHKAKQRQQLHNSTMRHHRIWYDRRKTLECQRKAAGNGVRTDAHFTLLRNQEDSSATPTPHRNRAEKRHITKINTPTISAIPTPSLSPHSHPALVIIEKYCLDRHTETYFPRSHTSSSNI